jgi:hypothetical protein
MKSDKHIVSSGRSLASEHLNLAVANLKSAGGEKCPQQLPMQFLPVFRVTPISISADDQAAPVQTQGIRPEYIYNAMLYMIDRAFCWCQLIFAWRSIHSCTELPLAGKSTARPFKISHAGHSGSHES